MAERTLAKRYARALLSVAQDAKLIDKVEEELHGVAEAWRGSADLRSVIGDPSRSREEKRAVLQRLFGARVSEPTLRLLGLLLRKKRFAHIEEIAEAYDDLSDEIQDVATARVTAFMALDDAQRKALIARIQRLTDRSKIQLEEVVDPSILGGIIVRIGDQVVDGSVRGRLRAMRERLLVRVDQIAAEAAGMVGATQTS